MYKVKRAKYSWLVELFDVIVSWVKKKECRKGRLQGYNHFYMRYEIFMLLLSLVMVILSVQLGN